MMNKEKLELLWNSIVHLNLGEFEYKLLSKDSIPQLNIGYNSLNERCLILELPTNFSKVFQEFQKQNITLNFFNKEKCLCIILKDEYFTDLFDDLIMSTYSKMFLLDDPLEYSSLFITHFLKWSAFFDNKAKNQLSREQIKGIFGELFFLKQLLVENKAPINDILNTWRGPFDEGHDFVFDFLDYEVKAIDDAKNNIQISSEFQLESEVGKELALVVITLNPDTIHGLTIKILIDEIKIFVFNNNGDNSIFLNALAQKRLDFYNLEQYNHYAYTPIEQTFFNVSDVKFPKLIKTNLPKEINSVFYCIRLNLIEEFITNKIKY